MDPETPKKPLTRERLLSIVEYRLEKIQEAGRRTGRIMPEELERFRQIQQVLEKFIADTGQPIVVQLFSALAKIKLPLAEEHFSGNRETARQLLEEIEATRDFVKGEMALATDEEPDYKEWLSRKK